MYNITSEIKKSLRRIIAVRSDYILNQDRLELNNNRKLHELILTVYSVIATDKLMMILQKLELVSTVGTMEELDVLHAHTLFETEDYVIDINAAFKYSDCKEEIMEISNDLAFFVTEMENALYKLKTTL